MSRPPAVITVVYDTAEIVPHFVAHYASITSGPIVVVDAGAGIGDIADADVLRVAPHAFSDEHKRWCEAMAIDSLGTLPEEYVVRVDVDELIRAPVDFDAMSKACRVAGIDAVPGHVVDRLAISGMPPIAQGRSIWDQFPVQCDIAGGDRRKIVLARAGIDLHPAHHDVPGSVRKEVPTGRRGDYVVHHFKWNAATVARLSPRVDATRYGQRCQAAIDLCLLRKQSP